MERILITGVGGFIGSRLAFRFLQEGFFVVGVDDLSNGNIKNVPHGVEFIHGDLAQKSTLNRIPKDCRKILHLAGQSSGEISFDDPVLDLNKNTVSTLNLIEFGINNAVERFIYASSMAVYGTVRDAPINERQNCYPLSCYGVGKLASENYLRIYEKKLPYVIMRMFNVYGPGQDLSNLRQGMVSIFLAQALRTGNISVKGGLDRFRDLIYIDDVVDAWFNATMMENALRGTFNIGTGIKTTVGQLLDKICSHIGGSTYHIEAGTPGDQSGIYADTNSIRDLLKIEKFTPLDVGLEKFIEASKRDY